MNWASVMDSSVSRNMRFLNSRMAWPSRALPFLRPDACWGVTAGSGRLRGPARACSTCAAADPAWWQLPGNVTAGSRPRGGAAAPPCPPG